MLSFIKRHLTSLNKPLPAHQAQQLTASKAPVMRQQQARRHYYFNAPRHTAKSLRILVNDLQEHVGSPDKPSGAGAQVKETMYKMLHSVNIPDIRNPEKQRDFFQDMVRLHLSSMTADELAGLEKALKAADFQCLIEVPGEDEEKEFVYTAFGSPDDDDEGPLHRLLKTEELYDIIHELRAAAGQRQQPALAPETAVAVRNSLGPCLSAWQASGKSLDDLSAIATRLARALGMDPLTTAFALGEPGSRLSMLDWDGKTMTISPEVALELMEEKDGYLFSAVLRDLTEALLAQKLFGPEASVSRLGKADTAALATSLDQIYTQAPAAPSEEFALAARALLARSEQFGAIDIAPTVGGNVGHAWIAPELSVSPDQQHEGKMVGKRFMHLGSNPAPGEARIKEWPMRFLTDADNALKYGRDGSWKLIVPVDKDRLAAAAKEVREEWTRLGLPYRFASTGPGMRPTGCRVTVFEAVIRGMDTPTRVLFDHFNAGLPEPDSPTELWERFDQFMGWVRKLAAE